VGIHREELILELKVFCVSTAAWALLVRGAVCRLVTGRCNVHVNREVAFSSTGDHFRCNKTVNKTIPCAYASASSLSARPLFGAARGSLQPLAHLASRFFRGKDQVARADLRPQLGQVTEDQLAPRFQPV